MLFVDGLFLEIAWLERQYTPCLYCERLASLRITATAISLLFDYEVSET
jgi:hypothetical protein